jgi:hypothetical protein
MKNFVYYALLIIIVIFTILTLDHYKSEEKIEDKVNELKADKEPEIEFSQPEMKIEEPTKSEEEKCPQPPVVEVIEEKIEIIKVDTGKT